MSVLGIPTQRARDLITEPGIYDLPEAVYHSDPTPDGSMSSTTARRILEAGGPARVQWERKHPVVKDVFDLGSVVHMLVLGKGADIAEVDADTWQTNVAKAAKREARAEGKTPILSKDLAAAKVMQRKVMAHPKVRSLRLFDTTDGVSEQSFFWRDPETGIMRRAMVDWMRDVAVDLKTSHSASPKSLPGVIADHGYDQQNCWYTDGLAAHGIDIPFLFVVVESKPPHFVSVIDLHDEFLDRGDRRNRQAIDLWVQCRESGVWPEYSDEIQTISPPRWARYEETS